MLNGLIRPDHIVSPLIGFLRGLGESDDRICLDGDE